MIFSEGFALTAHIFLTGEIQVGKSTLIRRLLAALGPLRLGGFRTVSAPDAETGELGVFLLPAAEPDAPRTAENRVGLRIRGRGGVGEAAVFDRAGCAALAGAEDAQLILMDEIGRMEREAAAFTARIGALLDCEKPILGVLRGAAHTPLAERVRAHPATQLVTVAPENREALFGELLERLRGQIH